MMREKLFLFVQMSSFSAINQPFEEGKLYEIGKEFPLDTNLHMDFSINEEIWGYRHAE